MPIFDRFLRYSLTVILLTQNTCLIFSKVASAQQNIAVADAKEAAGRDALELVQVQTGKMEKLFSKFEESYSRVEGSRNSNDLDVFADKRDLRSRFQEGITQLTIQLMQRLRSLREAFGDSADFDKVEVDLNEVHKQMVKRLTMEKGVEVIFQTSSGTWELAVVVERKGKFLTVKVHSTGQQVGQIESPRLELQVDRENSACTGFKNVYDRKSGRKKAIFARVPKTGSTTAMEVFEVERCYAERILVYDHGGGCENLALCNATCNAHEPGPAFGVIRDPCAWFRSAAMQLAGELPKDHEFGKRLWRLREPEAINALLEFYEASGCVNNTDPNCLVRFVNVESRQWGARWEPRVILYPQSFYVNKDYNIICYTPNETVPKLVAGLSKATGCPMPAPGLLSIQRNNRHYPSARAMPKDVCRRVRRAMASDAALFDAHCSHEPFQIPHEA